MRISIVTRGYTRVGGATDELTYDLATTLAAAGNRVTILCSSAAGNMRQRPLRLVEDGVFINRIWTPGWGRFGGWGKFFDNFIFYPLVCWTAMWRSLRDDRQIILDLPIPLGWLARPTRIISRGRCRTICWLLDLMPDKAVACTSGIKQMIWKALRSLNNEGFRAADFNVVLGKCMYQFVRNKGVDPSKLRIIGTWSRGDEVIPMPPGKSSVRAEQNVAGKFVVMYAGFAGPWHDFESVEAAMIRLRDDERIRFAFLASGPHVARLERLVRDHDLKNVAFWPRFRREHAAEHIGAADVHLVTQNPHYSGMCVPCKLYGIMAAARPVIYVGDLDCQTAIDIHDAQCGLTVATHDADGLVKAIQALAADQDNCIELGTRGRRTFMEKHDRKIRTSQWNDLLVHLADRPTPLTAKDPKAHLMA